MKVMILAGGLGTRISEETESRPKPMIEIGGRPILWHVMKIFSTHGHNDFVICLGHKGDQIRNYFLNYFYHQSDFTISTTNNQVEVHNTNSEQWRITLADTGETTMTGGRIKRAAKYITGDDFLLTYGDGVGDVDIGSLIEFHRSHGRLVTLTGTKAPARFGQLTIKDHIYVSSFAEKPSSESGLINGGFFVVNKKALTEIEGDQTVWEERPLESLASKNQLAVYRHPGFWLPMDTYRDKRKLVDLWESGQAAWKIWK